MKKYFVNEQLKRYIEVSNYVMMDILYEFFVSVQSEKFLNLCWIQRLPAFPCGLESPYLPSLVHISPIKSDHYTISSAIYAAEKPVLPLQLEFNFGCIKNF